MGINLIGEKWIITDGIQMENKGQLINEKRGQEPDLEGVCVCVCVCVCKRGGWGRPRNES